jgi:hypothetical protein
MHEHEFADEMRAALTAAGVGDSWVLPLFGPNAAFPHGTPEGRALRDGDLVLVDTGGFLHGYASRVRRPARGHRRGHRGRRRGVRAAGRVARSPVRIVRA